MRIRTFLSATLLLSSALGLAQAELIKEKINYEADGITFKGYLAWDDALSGQRPGVLVVHEWWGLNDYARSRADQLAREGYVALAVDMYGEGKTAGHPKDAGAFASAVMEDPKGARKRFEAAMAVLEDHPKTQADRAAAIGYCFGGATVLNMARSGLDLAAVASFHGSLGTRTPAKEGQVKARILVCNGADDPFVKKEAIDAFHEEMNNAGVDYQFENYPGAVHGFTNPGATSLGKKFELPLAYQREADEKSWTSLLALLREVFPR